MERISITPAYCNEFHRVAWDAACQINNENPLAVAEGIKDMYRACERLISRHGTSSAAVMAVKALAKINKDNAPSAP